MPNLIAVGALLIAIAAHALAVASPASPRTVLRLNFLAVFFAGVAMGGALSSLLS